MVRPGIRSLVVAALAAAAVLGSGATSHATAILTDLVQFSSDSTGASAGGNIWNTRAGDGFFNAWVIEGTPAGAFVNGPADAQAAISITLPVGATQFSLYEAPGGDTGFAGLNLFFNGSSTPGISVFAPTQTNATVPGFSADSSPSTVSPAGPVLPGAGTLTFTSGSDTITLSNYQWALPSVNNSDRVGSTTTGADGTNDFIGQFTLTRVTTAPEPGSFALTGVGILSLAFFGRRSRGSARQ